MREGSVKLIKLTNGELIIGTVKTEEHDDLVSSFRNTNDFLRMNVYIRIQLTFILGFTVRTSLVTTGY